MAPPCARTVCLQSMGVAVKMVTGDQFAIAVETCKRLGMGSTIMEGKTVMAGLKHKYNSDDHRQPWLALTCVDTAAVAGAVMACLDVVPKTVETCKAARQEGARNAGIPAGDA
eukprot:1138531-Pelagomonas_calceolata.AAC.9